MSTGCQAPHRLPDNYYDRFEDLSPEEGAVTFISEVLPMIMLAAIPPCAPYSFVAAPYPSASTIRTFSTSTSHREKFLTEPCVPGPSTRPGVQFCEQRVALPRVQGEPVETCL